MRNLSKYRRDSLTCAKLLGDEFTERKRNALRYSLRSFAKDLAVSPSVLSRILSGERTVPVKNAALISRKLGWGKEQAELFEKLAVLDTVKDKSERTILKRQLKNSFADKTEYTLVKENKFNSASRWYHYAILELAERSPQLINVVDIVDRFRISPLEAELALGKLLHLGLLRKHQSEIRPASKFRKVPPMPSLAIRNFHKEVIQKALRSVDEQSYESRDVSAVIMAVDPTRLAEAEKRIASFRLELTNFLNGGTGEKTVYALAVQLFSLEKPGN